MSSKAFGMSDTCQTRMMKLEIASMAQCRRQVGSGLGKSMRMRTRTRTRMRMETGRSELAFGYRTFGCHCRTSTHTGRNVR